LTYIFISHDLAVVKHVADRIAVMNSGRIVESADTEDLFAAPGHPYSRALLSAIPVPSARAKRDRMILQGDPPSVLDPPPGCRFHPRCPHVMEICKRMAPPTVTVAPDHNAACWLHVDSGERVLEGAGVAPASSPNPQGEAEVQRPP